MPTSPTPMTPLPTPVPSRADRTNFAARADAFLAALPDFQTELDAVAETAYDNAVEAAASAAAAAGSVSDAAEQVALATAQADAAEASAVASAQSAGASIWVSGTAYNVGDVAWSPTNGLVYRILFDLEGPSTIDPALDPTNWVLVVPENVFAQLALINQGVI